jgi:hypothetical protein
MSAAAELRSEFLVGTRTAAGMVTDVFAIR